MTNTYDHPVAQLLTLGEVGMHDEWADYATLGLTSTHIPALIQMALDKDLLWADSDTDEVWAPLHAWRALGQLRAESAVEPLVTLFAYLDEEIEDWISEDLPQALGLIGPAAIPVLRDFLADATHGVWARVAASESLVRIVLHDPASRNDVIPILSAQLARFAEQERNLNACLVADLVSGLHAAEAAPIIEQAFAADAVDLMMMGDWEDVQIELGLLTRRKTSQRDYAALEMPEIVDTRRVLQAFAEQQRAESPQPARLPGRNDPCWCGSGKKYKHCHMQADRQG